MFGWKSNSILVGAINNAEHITKRWPRNSAQFRQLSQGFSPSLRLKLRNLTIRRARGSIYLQTASPRTRDSSQILNHMKMNFLSPFSLTTIPKITSYTSRIQINLQATQPSSRSTTNDLQTILFA